MKLAEALKGKDVILLDGAMGTELDKRGLMARGRTNLDAPEAVIAIHEQYLQCGSSRRTTSVFRCAT